MLVLLRDWKNISSFNYFSVVHVYHNKQRENSRRINKQLPLSKRSYISSLWRWPISFSFELGEQWLGEDKLKTLSKLLATFPERFILSTNYKINYRSPIPMRHHFFLFKFLVCRKCALNTYFHFYLLNHKYSSTRSNSPLYSLFFTVLNKRTQQYQI